MQYLSQRLASKPVRAREGKRPRAALPGRQRERILAAVEKLVAEKGRAGASIEAIVKAAGVSSVTFYEHFEGKEECFVAAFDRAVEETVARLREAVSEEAPLPERIHVGLRTLLALVAAEPDRARLCLVEAQAGGPRLSARYQATLDRVAPVLREGRGLDTAGPELPDTLEEATVGGVAWLLRERLESGGGGGVEALLPKLVNIALSPYLGGDGTEPLAAGPALGHG
jgi:AcrR family transcriptional regulator